MLLAVLLFQVTDEVGNFTLLILDFFINKLREFLIFLLLTLFPKLIIVLLLIRCERFHRLVPGLGSSLNIVESQFFSDMFDLKIQQGHLHSQGLHLGLQVLKRLSTREVELGELILREYREFHSRNPHV